MESGIVFWEKKITLSEVSWNHNAENKFNFSSKVLQAIQTHWKSLICQYPALYNGRILVLEDFYFSSGNVKLTTSWIKFSHLSFHVHNELKLPRTYGVLGCQILVTNPEDTHFLIGERSQKSEYKPGFLTLPGGMFEVSDIERSIQDACLRELEEELSIQIDENQMDLIAILRGISGTTTILMIKTRIKATCNGLAPDAFTPVTGNEEWENNSLQWLPFAQLPNLESAKFMEGLTYLHSKKS